jgi:hypothetical protein
MYPGLKLPDDLDDSALQKVMALTTQLNATEQKTAKAPSKPAQSIPSSSLPLMNIPEDIPDFSDRTLFPGQLESGQLDDLKRVASELTRDHFIQPQSSECNFTSYLSSAGKMRVDYSPLIPQLADPNIGLSIDSTAFLRARSKYKVFSCLKIQSSEYCWPVQMDPASVETTAFTVDGVQYGWCMLPKDMPGASSAFHGVLQSLLANVPNCSVMVDKVLVYSQEMKLHAQQDIKAVFDVLKQNGMAPDLDQSSMIQGVSFPAFQTHPCARVFLESKSSLKCTSKMGFSERDITTSKEACNGGMDVPGAVLQHHNGAGSAGDQKATQKAWHLMLTGFWQSHGAEFQKMWCSLPEEQMTCNLRTVAPHMPKTAERPTAKEKVKAASQPWWMKRDRPSFKTGSANLQFKGKGARIKASNDGARGMGGGRRKDKSTQEDLTGAACELTPELCLSTLVAEGGNGLIALFASRAGSSCENMQFTRDEHFVIEAVNGGELRSSREAHLVGYPELSPSLLPCFMEQVGWCPMCTGATLGRS